MPTVDIEGFGRVQFPDDMTPEQIDSTIRTQVMRSPQYVQGRLAQIDAKYNPLTQQPQQSNGVGDFLKGALGGLYETAKHYGYDLPTEAQADVTQRAQAGDYTGALKAAFEHGIALGSTPVVMAKDAASAQVAQGQQAVQAAKDGRYSEAFGHGLAAVTPVVGPAAAQAGEDIGAGKFAQGAGEATALLAPVAADAVGARIGASPRVQAIADSAAGKLADSAEKDWYSALNPTTKINKALVQNKIAPGLADRGQVFTSLKDLRETAQANLADYGQKINDYFDDQAAKGATMDPAPVIQKLQAAKDAATVDGVSLNEPYTNKLDSLEDQIKSIADKNSGSIPLDKLRKIRQAHDEQVAASRGGFALAPDANSQVSAIKQYSDAIRSTFADQHPDLAATNGEFSFWKDVDKVAGDTQTRRVGQRGPLTEKLAQGVGAAVGAHTFGPAGAIAGVEVAGKLARLRNSVIWKSVSAETKGRIADLLDSGNPTQALQVANRAAAIAAASGQNVAPVNQ